MKISIFVFFLLIFFNSCTSHINANINNAKIKKIVEAAYYVENDSLLTREDCLKNNISSTEFYDIDGNLINNFVKAYVDSLDTRTIFIRNKEKREIKRFTYESNGKILNYSFIKTDDNINQIYEEEYDFDGSLYYINSTKFDNRGNNVESHTNFVKKKKLAFTISKYNNKDLLIEESDNHNYDSIIEKRLFVYDKKGNVIEEKFYRSNTDFVKFINVYDKNNNVIKQKTFDKNNKESEEINITYVYDKVGNWITLKRFINKKIDFVREREITYY